MTLISKRPHSNFGLRQLTPFLLLPLAAQIAQAQSTQTEPVLEEIVVTALRRAEGTAIMDTALAVDAMTGAELEGRGFTSVMDALSTTPGLSVNKSSNVGDAVQVRGVSAIIGDAVVGYYIDDLPYTRINANVAPDLNPYDLNRVEVLRGPQGTLFGAGSLGGTVRVITQDPVMDEFSGKMTGAYSSTEDAGENYKVQGAVNIPFGDSVALRLVGAYVDEDGFIDLPLVGEDEFNTMEDTSYRAKLRWNPDDNWDIVGSYWHSEREGYQNFADNEDYEYFPAFLDFGTGELIPATSNELRAETENDLYGLTIRYSADTFTFLSTTSYLDGDNFSGIPFYFEQSTGGFDELETFAQEFKLSSINEGSWNWTAGFIYLDMTNKEYRETYSYVFGRQDAPLITAERTSESYAVFGESIHELSDTWELTLGLRYFYDERTAEEDDPTINDLLPVFGIDPKREDDWDQWTGRVNLGWRPTDDSLYYANIAQGFRAGGHNPASAVISGIAFGLDVPSTLDPDEVISYELGAKWVLMDGALNLESVVYYLDWDDIQTFFLLATETGIVGGAVNGESAQAVGFELAATYSYEGLTLSLAGNINDTEYDGEIAGSGISDGDPVMHVPELTWSASAAYNWTIGGLGASASLIANYVDERTDYAPADGFIVLEDVKWTSEDFTMLNARIGVEGDNWSAYLTGDNLLDEDGEVSQLATLIAYGIPSNRLRPRTWGIELNYNF